MSTPLSRPAFRAHLVSLGDAPAGHRNDCGACPLTEFLRAIGVPCPWVGRDYWSGAASFPTRRIPLEFWAIAFRETVDENDARYALDPISAAECLRILDTIPEASDA